VLSVAQMRDWERATWATGKTEAEVIAQVGRIVARRALELTRPGEPILILAGKGHNGEDARQTQPHLAGREVRLLNVVDPAEARGGALRFLLHGRNRRVNDVPALEELSDRGTMTRAEQMAMMDSNQVLAVIAMERAGDDHEVVADSGPARRGGDLDPPRDQGCQHRPHRGQGIDRRASALRPLTRGVRAMGMTVT